MALAITADRAKAESAAIAGRLPPLLIAAERIAATVTQGVHGRRRVGSGDVFWQHRPYYPGDELKRLDWRQSAKSDKIYLREMEWSAAQRVSRTHGDWSPKNLLVAPHEVWAIDWEVIHYGDPSFDVGFLLNHLLLKSIARPQWRREFAGLARVFIEALRAGLPASGEWIVEGGVRHLPALLPPDSEAVAARCIHQRSQLGEVRRAADTHSESAGLPITALRFSRQIEFSETAGSADVIS